MYEKSLLKIHLFFKQVIELANQRKKYIVFKLHKIEYIFKATIRNFKRTFHDIQIVR